MSVRLSGGRAPRVSREFAFFSQILEGRGGNTVFYNIIYKYIYIYINIYIQTNRNIYMYMCTRANTLHMGVEYWTSFSSHERGAHIKWLRTFSLRKFLRKCLRDNWWRRGEGRRKGERKRDREREREREGGRERRKYTVENTRTAAGDERFVRISTIHVIVNNVT